MNGQTHILDYGSGNIYSIVNALKYCGTEPLLISDPEAVPGCSHLIIPGVGAFHECMNKLKDRGLIEPIMDSVKRGNFILGICVGLQMLFEEGEEFGLHPGLSLIKGRVERIPECDQDGTCRKVPFVGWSPVVPSRDEKDWHGTIMENTPAGQACYFTHSYRGMPVNDEDRLVDTFYGQTRVCAAVRRDNLYGCQFHPERSGAAGLAILSNFIEL
jgi:glutamine amidotransferase